MRKSTRVTLISTVLQVLAVSVAYAAEADEACVEGDATIEQGNVFDVDAYEALADSDQPMASDDCMRDTSNVDDAMSRPPLDVSCDGICAEWCAAVCEVDPAQLG